jgi:hypothetical protein
VAVFTDAFTGSNNDALEGRSGWTRDGGAAGAAAVNASNQLKGASATDTGYYAPDTASADHYCQGSIKNNAHSSFPLICRYQDRQNWGAGLRIQSVSSVRLYTRVAGAFTELANYGTPSGGFNAADVWRLEVSGSTATIYRNGSVFNTQAISNFPTATKVGLNARTATYDPWLDDWESDALAGSGDVTVTPGAGAIVLDGLAPTVAAGVTVSPAPGTLTVAGLAPTVSAGVTVAPGTGTIAVAGQVPTVSTAAGAGVTVTPGAGTITVAGLAPTVSAGVTVAPSPGTVTVSGRVPVVSAGVVVLPSVGAIVLQGRVPTVSTEDAAAGATPRDPCPEATARTAGTLATARSAAATATPRS